VQVSLELFRTTDEISIDENLGHCGATADRAQSCFCVVAVQHQFFELEARVAQQTLGAYAVFAAVTRKDGCVLGPGGVRCDVIEDGIGIGNLGCSRVFDKIGAVQSLDFMSFSLFTMPLFSPLIPFCPQNYWQCPANVILVFWRVPLNCVRLRLILIIPRL
jgi:hypothetical protein